MNLTFPKRAPEASKRDFGHLLVLGGATGMAGAPALAARAARRPGVGLWTVGTPRSPQPIMATKLTEAMTLGLPETQIGSLAWPAVNEILDYVGRRRIAAVALGPGLTVHQGTVAFVEQFIPVCPSPLVLDADGLNALKGQVSILKKAISPVILTPHLMEMRRLTRKAAGAISRNREGEAKALAAAYKVICLLKGHRTVVSDGTRVYVNKTGNPGMASGGMGDVLTGVIGALLAQGRDPYEAACLGAYVHGLAGDLAVRQLGQWGMMASDVIDHLPPAIRRITR